MHEHFDVASFEVYHSVNLDALYCFVTFEGHAFWNLELFKL